MAAVEGTVIACHTEDEFDAQLETSMLVIIDFMTTWCPGCQAMAPGKVAKKYEIHSIATFYFIRHGEPLESVATVDPDELEDTINKNYYFYVAGTPPTSASASA